MDTLSRRLAPAVVAVGIGIAALSPVPVHAEHGDDLVRVLVDVADVVLRGGVPYYRHGGYGYDDHLIVVRDRHGRLVYYRQVPRRYVGNIRYDDYDYGYYRDVRCNRHGKCTITYYDPRYDRDGRRYDNRYYRYDHRRWYENHDD